MPRLLVSSVARITSRSASTRGVDADADAGVGDDDVGQALRRDAGAAGAGDRGDVAHVGHVDRGASPAPALRRDPARASRRRAARPAPAGSRARPIERQRLADAARGAGDEQQRRVMRRASRPAAACAATRCVSACTWPCSVSDAREVVVLHAVGVELAVALRAPPPAGSSRTRASWATRAGARCSTAIGCSLPCAGDDLRLAVEPGPRCCRRWRAPCCAVGGDQRPSCRSRGCARSAPPPSCRRRGSGCRCVALDLRPAARRRGRSAGR